MANYSGFQLPKISENSLDEKKERKQILNYLALLDEKLRYMFQNIDIEENLSEESQKMLFGYGDAIRNVVKDTEGNFSLFEQTINSISFQVQDLEGNHAILQQTAEGLFSKVASVEGNVSMLQQTAERIETSVHDLDGDVSTLQLTADGINSTVKSLGNNLNDLDDTVSKISQKADRIDWIVASGDSVSNMTMTDSFLQYIGNHVTVKADLRLHGEMAVYKSASSNTVGGYIEYETGKDELDGATRGLAIKDRERNNYFITTEEGIRMYFQEPDEENETLRKHSVYCSNYGPRMQWNEIDLSDGQVKTTSEVRVAAAGIYLSFKEKSELDYGTDEYEVYLDPTELRLNASSFCCLEDGLCELGTESKRWLQVCAIDPEINTSDRKEKTDILYEMDMYEALFNKLKPTQFKRTTGTSGRFHVGFIAQDVEDAMDEIGMDSKDFAGFIKSPLYRVEIDDSGEEVETEEVVGERYALRYSEFIALNTHMIQKLMKRVEELEKKVGAMGTP